MKIIHKVQW